MILMKKKKSKFCLWSYVLTKKVNSEQRECMVYLSSRTPLYNQQGQCATVLFPRDTVVIILALYNKSVAFKP